MTQNKSPIEQLVVAANDVEALAGVVADDAKRGAMALDLLADWCNELEEWYDTVHIQEEALATADTPPSNEEELEDSSLYQFLEADGWNAEALLFVYTEACKLLKREPRIVTDAIEEADDMRIIAEAFERPAPAAVEPARA